MLFNILPDPQTLNAVQGEHSASLVLLSWLVALAASYAGLDIIKLVSKGSQPAWRRAWLWAGASAMGLGVWSMHFIGMHAYRLDFPVSHAPVPTLLSIIPAILGSFSAMWVLSRDAPSHRALLLAGLALGAGIGVMHYSGMAAMRAPAELYHVLDLFLVSLLVAIGLGMLSVYAYRLCQHEWGMQRARTCAFIAALCVSIAVCGMHYVAMQAAWFLPLPDATPSISPASHWIIFLIGGVGVLTALLALIAASVQRRLQASERHEHMTHTRLLEVVSSLQDSVILLDEQARIRLCNASFERQVGLRSDQLMGLSVSQLAYAEDSHTLSQHIRRALDKKGQWGGMITALRSDGNGFPAWLSVSRVTYADSDDRDYVALLSDRSEEQQAQQRIRYLAYHDMLTELPNRRALQEHLAGFARQHPSPDAHAFLALLDIDRFKMLNDSLGQDIGDELLRQLGRRLQQWSGARLYVARLDGNEFALVGELASRDPAGIEREAQRQINAMQASLTADYQLQGHTYPCRLNVGVLVFCPHEDLPAAQLFKRAGLALLEAKRQRDGEAQFFQQAQEDELEDRLTLERELKHAIDHDELCLHLQPQVDAHRQVIGAEALVRWQHPERGMISPGRFIPIAEETGLILPLGHWVLKEGCRLLGEWRHQPACCHLKLSLNVSVRQFQQPDFADQVLAVIQQYDAPPERLTLELTESLLLSDPDGTICKMQQLQQRGVSFALDDFGTGYSSLAYLKLLPLDTLKIDITFVRDLTLDMQATPIAATIVALAESLGLGVIAEGVETEDQRLVLANLGCRIYQGFLFGRPVQPESFSKAIQCHQDK
ncbi:EAL domain-containing protein [Vreelandella arcis]|uniref:PAS domain S-box-containing protein/diguanylate cyclase (GGDEF) domain-containing protein n=1 Tax=Vreelandella arcis TaxID=416873 RepID=A0A1G9XD37_9GAMM|nr:EAL domain-containing protein [Halomonas arcis]SDM94719.1 PAS domain S-box-containing protein/diguanylate cyclase (GGDEF) domain-containing protein [Halomonas arcis]